jgi:hypothetical protein
MRLAEENPPDMGPECADAGRVRVERLVRVLVMLAMGGHPEDRPALERQRTADCQEIFEQPGRLEPAVGVQPVIPHADAQADGHPVEDRGRDQMRPGEGEERGDRLNVEPYQHEAGQPAQLGITGRSGQGNDAAHVAISFV